MQKRHRHNNNIVSVEILANKKIELVNAQTQRRVLIDVPQTYGHEHIDSE